MKMDIKTLRKELRTAIADYKKGEGCGCCSDEEKQDLAEDNIAKLLNVKKYDDGSGYNFSKYESK